MAMLKMSNFGYYQQKLSNLDENLTKIGILVEAGITIPGSGH